MPNRRLTSRKQPSIDLDQELDEMYSSPITRPNLGFLRVAIQPPQDRSPVALRDDDGPESVELCVLKTPELPKQPGSSIDSMSTDTASMDVLSARAPDAIPVGPELDWRSNHAASTVAARPNGKWKLHRCSTVQDGHSANEQILYDLLWRTGKPISADEREIQISRENMAAQTRITVRNIKGVLDRLIEKLAVSRALEPNSFTRIAATYKVFSFRTILDRRRRAGLEWVTRANGVRFIPKEMAETILARPKFAHNDPSQPDAGPRDGASDDNGSMDISSDVARNGASIPPVLGPGLRKINPAFDSAAVARLWRECRRRIPDCNAEEVLHFTTLKATRLQADRSIRNPVGLLLISVPEFFDVAIVGEFRAERSRQVAEGKRIDEENRRYWRSILDDPNSTEEDKQFARRFAPLAAE